MSRTTTDRIPLSAALRASLNRLRHDYVFAASVFVALLCLAAVTQTLGTAIARMSYPYALEWMEGLTMDHVRRILQGKPIYVEPSFEWTPALYTPLYYWVCAAFMKVFGVSLFWARFVSTVSFAASLVLIGAFIRKEVGGVVGPIIGAGLYAITFPLTGAWIDLARVDSLFLALLFAGAYCARHRTSRASGVAAGVLLFLAFFTKQTALALALPVIFGATFIDWRRGLVIGATFTGLAIGAVQWMGLVSNGWFRYYVFEIPRKHELAAIGEWHHVLNRTTWETMPVAVALALAGLVGGAVKGWRVTLFYAGLVAGAAAAAFSTLAKAGGFINATIPYCAVIAMLCGMTIARVLEKTPELAVGRRMQVGVVAAVLLQLVALGYDQRPFVPRRRDVNSGNAMLERWRDLRGDGDVFSFSFGYYDALAGGDDVHAHTMAILDVARTDPALNARLVAQFGKAMASHRYRAVIWDDSYSIIDRQFETLVKNYYYEQGALFDHDHADHTYPKTGFAVRPNKIYVPLKR